MEEFKENKAKCVNSWKETQSDIINSGKGNNSNSSDKLTNKELTSCTTIRLNDIDRDFNL